MSRRRVAWVAAALLIAGCAGSVPPSPSATAQDDPRLADCAGDLAVPPALLVQPLSDVGPVWSTLFGVHEGLTPEGSGLLVIGQGLVAEPALEGPGISGLGLVYDVCLVDGLVGGSTTTYHTDVYSGTSVPLPGGAFELP